MAFTTTKKIKIRNTILLLDETPNYNSGQLGNVFSGAITIAPDSLKYLFDLPDYLKFTDIVSFRLYDIKGAVDDWGYLILNEHTYKINGGGWNLCNSDICFQNIWNSPFFETNIIVPMELIKNTNNSLTFYGYSQAGMSWLILNSFKFSVNYISK